MFIREVISSIDNSCGICLGRLSDDCDKNHSTLCSHKFHKKCLVRWLGDNIICPVCSEPLSSMEVFLFGDILKPDIKSMSDDEFYKELSNGIFDELFLPRNVKP